MFKSIQARFAVVAGACIVLSTGALVVASAQGLLVQVRKASSAELAAHAEGLAEQVNARVVAASGAARGLAQTLAGVVDEDIGLDLSRESVHAILGQTLLENEGLLTVFTAWETDAFDGFDAAYEGVEGFDPTGRMASACVKDGDTFRVEALSWHLEEGAEAAAYVAPRESARGYVSPPFRVGDRDVVRVSSPIRSSGEFYGVVGVELDLAFVDDIVNGAALAEAGVTARLFSPSLDLLSATATPGGENERGVGFGRGALEDRDGRDPWFEIGEEEAVAGVALALVGAEEPWWVLVGLPSSVVEAPARASVLRIVLLGLVLILIGIALAWFAAGGVARPVREAAALMRSFGEGGGDLTRRLPEGGTGELGELAHGFNGFVEELHDLVVAVAERADRVLAASGGLTHEANEMSASADRTSDDAGRAVESTESIRAEIDMVASAMEQMSASIREISQGASKVSDVATSAAAVTRETSDQLSRLDEVSQEIGEVMSLIGGIAEQTNLLALNATIEAARAGAAGKGFSVVASEVKALASETSQSTAEIERRVQAMQASTQQVVESIAGVAAMITDVDRMSGSIAGAVEEQTATTGSIGGSVGLAARGCHGVAETMGSLAGASAATSQGAQRARQAAADLEGLATELRELVGHFRV